MIIRRHNSGNVAFDTHTQISNLPPIYSAQIFRPGTAEWDGNSGDTLPPELFNGEF